MISLGVFDLRRLTRIAEHVGLMVAQGSLIVNTEIWNKSNFKLMRTEL